ncbi:MAG: hypothetical protein JXA33_19845, partial [Anaerolineae bacterium]|nr:hypothetical protein [Anaerolineae bacterium]
MANPPVRLRVLLAAVDEAAGDALFAEIQGTPHVRVVGGVWQADKVAEGVAAFDAQVVLLPESFPELPDVAVSQLRYTMPLHAHQVLTAYQATLSTPPTQDPSPTVQRTLAPPPVPPPAAPGLNLPRRAPTIRLGLWGAQGGVGVTTAIVLLARDLVKNGARVIVFDAPRRGDVVLYLDGTPSDQPQTIQGITVYPSAPTEE